MVSEAEIDQAINEIFTAYDKDHSGTLNAAELKAVLTDLFKAMGEPREFSAEEVNQVLTAIDKGGDGTISKGELKEVIKKLA